MSRALQGQTVEVQFGTARHLLARILSQGLHDELRSDVREFLADTTTDGEIARKQREYRRRERRNGELLAEIAQDRGCETCGNHFTDLYFIPRHPGATTFTRQSTVSRIHRAMEEHAVVCGKCSNGEGIRA